MPPCDGYTRVFQKYACGCVKFTYNVDKNTQEDPNLLFHEIGNSCFNCMGLELKRVEEMLERDEHGEEE